MPFTSELPAPETVTLGGVVSAGIVAAWTIVDFETDSIFISNLRRVPASSHLLVPKGGPPEFGGSIQPPLNQSLVPS